MKVLDLFSGIGGFSLGLEAAGMQTIAFCEKEPFCQADLRKNWPNVPCHDDVTKLDGSKYAGINVICGGFPCQDISLAGTGKGLAGERSGLWREYHRIIKETRPEWVIIENVSALRSRGLDEVLRSLAEIGYDAEWYCLPACAVGAPHRRDRIWIVAYPQGQRYTCGEPANATGQEREIEGSREAQGLRFSEPSNTHRVRHDAPDAFDEATYFRDAWLEWEDEKGYSPPLAHAQESPRVEPQKETDTSANSRKSGNGSIGCRESMAHADYPRLQGRISRILQERASERAAWTGGTSGVADANSEPPQWIAEPRLQCDPWFVEPPVGRVVDGLSGRVDRIKALGNAIVPQIAQVIGQAIMEYENDRA